ncbi:Ribonuclease NW [Zostera marina]|uniref:Ribonuclease NW n=1 Tax=Zostera marina TaxID=29655 RepID=A0A0K9PWV2_ZOSMR|nr:Ribonuclease NW [Zostera marina]
MKINFHLPLLVVFLSTFSLEAQQSYDYFYLVLQWPGSFCDSKQGCCYPTTGKPKSDFGIHGLWPNYNDGTYPSNCDANNPFDPSKIDDLMSSMQSEWPTLACPQSDGLKFWSHEWNKHGTCSESILDQHTYFQTALDFKKKLDPLQILQNAGIEPADGSSYSLSSISQALAQGVGGHEVGIQCNVDLSGNAQLFQLYFCLDQAASEIIPCPNSPSSTCSSDGIEFPVF